MANAWIGTSGFDYKEWKPGFYPPELPEKQYYATRLRSLELNNTFYQTPAPAKIAAWRAATPERFRFAIKCRLWSASLAKKHWEGLSNATRMTNS